MIIVKCFRGVSFLKGSARISALLAGLLVLTTVHTAWGADGPVVARKPSRLRTYRFAAKITKNGGVTPFKVGTMITGEFTYDLAAKDIRQDNSEYGWYKSSKSKLTFNYRQLRFLGTGTIQVKIASSRSHEHFAILTTDLNMPKGWRIEPHDTRKKYKSRTFGVMLQNAPSKGVLPNDAIPKILDLSKYVTTRHVRLDFFHGVHFPGGSIKRRATVYAVILNVTMIEAKPHDSK